MLISVMALMRLLVSFGLPPLRFAPAKRQKRPRAEPRGRFYFVCIGGWTIALVLFGMLLA